MATNCAWYLNASLLPLRTALLPWLGTGKASPRSTPHAELTLGQEIKLTSSDRNRNGQADQTEHINDPSLEDFSKNLAE